MDDQGRFIIPAEFRKDGKPFVGGTFEETKVKQDESYPEGNRHERRAAAAIERKTQELRALKKETENG